MWIKVEQNKITINVSLTCDDWVVETLGSTTPPRHTTHSQKSDSRIMCLVWDICDVRSATKQGSAWFSDWLFEKSMCL